MRKPTKAIIPAAGFGTRFLPQTKAMPKEMLPIVDKPIIQYVVEELVEAGIKDIIIVGSSNKRAIEDHFDLPNEDLLRNLRAGGEKKQPYIDLIESIADMANFIYVRQKGPHGNATPLLSASHLIEPDEYFVYAWADDFFLAQPNSTLQLIQTMEKHDGGVFACKSVEQDHEFDQYGIVDGDEIADHTRQMNRIIEKPGSDAAPTRLASVSNYLLPGSIKAYLESSLKEHKEGEFTLQPIVQRMIDDGHQFFAREITNGKYYDTGDKLEYLKTNIDFGLRHKDLGEELRRYLEEVLKR